MEQKQLTGSQAVLEACIAEGVSTIFGYPGGAIMPIYDALYDYKEKLNHILVRHEQGGIHAGQGYARSSGNVGVVFATSGPGATNLVTGLADAMIDSTPLVCITGQVFAHLLGTDAFQETDVINITMPVTKWNYQITDGRFSGGTHGFVVGHITPEAYKGGLIGLVEDGDIIELNVPKRTMTLKVDDATIAKRRAAQPAPKLKVSNGVLYKYAKLVKDASEGCVTDAD
jgi:hypothetical protein